jgi:hypothetical protein
MALKTIYENINNLDDQDTKRVMFNRAKNREIF